MRFVIASTAGRIIVTMRLVPLLLASVVALEGCKSVQQADATAWAGTPVAVLDQHPVLSTLQIVRTQSSDGTEIRNYVGKSSVAACSTASMNLADELAPAAYNTFSQCLRSHPACINVFYIENGTVTAFTPIGTGGMTCPTDERMQPNYHGPSAS